MVAHTLAVGSLVTAEVTRFKPWEPSYVVAARLFESASDMLEKGESLSRSAPTCYFIT